MSKHNNSLYITSGILGGRKIRTPNSKATHPMGSREKLALMNRLEPYIEGARVLDLYAGSGALGFEALSRGADRVVFVEKTYAISDVIADNADSLGVEGDIIILDEKVKTFFERTPHPSPLIFDVVIADPPYDAFDPADLYEVENVLAEDGVFALSHPGDAPELPGVSLDSTKSYARANLSLYYKNTTTIK